MATCKDCLHWKVCNEYRGAFWGHKAQYSSPIINASADSCIFYKDRSQFVELSCKAGDRLYVIFPKNKHIAEYVVTAFCVEESGTIIRIVDTRFFTVSILFTRDIGTKAFLTKEEAEQALKEREEND